MSQTSQTVSKFLVTITLKYLEHIECSEFVEVRRSLISWSDSLMLLGHVLEQQIWVQYSSSLPSEGGYHGLADIRFFDKLLFNDVLTFGVFWENLAVHVHNLDRRWQAFNSAWLRLS